MNAPHSLLVNETLYLRIYEVCQHFILGCVLLFFSLVVMKRLYALTLLLVLCKLSGMLPNV